MSSLNLDAIPEGWTVARLDEACDVNPRLNKSEIHDDLLVSFVPMPAVGAGDGSIDVSQERPASEVKKGFTAFKQGDVLFAKITPCMENGKMAVVPKVVNDYGFGSTEFHVLRPKDGIEARYVYYFVSSQTFRGVAERYMTGAVGQKRVSTTYLKEQQIPLAPLEQQKRIVAEIEKQFSRLDEAVANLKRVKVNLKRYKAAVLKAAVEGKLTEDWRKQHLPAPSTVPGKFYTYALMCDDNSIYIGHTDDIERRWKEHRQGQGAEWTQKHKPVKIAHYEELDSRAEAAEREKWLKTGFGRKWLKRELKAGRTRQAGDVESADRLLERILEERRANWQGRGKYKESAAPETEGLPEIPESWTWATLPQLGELNRGKSKHRPRNDPKLYGGPYPFVQTGDVRHAVGEIQGFSQTYSEEGLAQSRLWPTGTLCITIAANIADTAILGFEACFPDSVVGFIPESGQTDIRFVEYFIRTAKEDLERFAPATAQKNINLEILKAVSVPLPPVDEQRYIASEIEARLSVVECIEKTLDDGFIRADRLRQSILRKAFSGRL